MKMVNKEEIEVFLHVLKNMSRDLHSFLQQLCGVLFAIFYLCNSKALHIISQGFFLSKPVQPWVFLSECTNLFSVPFVYMSQLAFLVKISITDAAAKQKKQSVPIIPRTA